jgi:hypothetical protein
MEFKINYFNQILNKFDQLDKISNQKVNIYLIGGAVLLEQGLKQGTKDIDLILTNDEDYNYFCNLLKKDNSHQLELPEKEYLKLKISEIIIQDDFRFDVFNKVVCDKLYLSKEMIKRARLIKEYKHLNLYACSNEDILIFKSITERPGDIDDCLELVKKGLNWNVILEEIQNQVKESKQQVWITWFEERLNLLEDKGVSVSIIQEIRELSEGYYKLLEEEKNE